MDAPGAEVQQILRYLEHDGYTFEQRSTDIFVVRADRPGAFAHEPVLGLPRALLTAYLEDSSRRFYQSFADPYAEALSMTEIHFMEALGTDHGDGVNWVRSTGIRRGRDGHPELFINQDPPPYGRPDPDGTYEWAAERPPS